MPGNPTRNQTGIPHSVQIGTQNYRLPSCPADAPPTPITASARVASSSLVICQYGSTEANGRRAYTAVILAGKMPLVELSEGELKYLATMNSQNIFVMKQITRKNNTVFPDLTMAERIQAKFEAVLPDGVPDPFSPPAAQHSPKAEVRKAGAGQRAKKR